MQSAVSMLLCGQTLVSGKSLQFGVLEEDRIKAEIGSAKDDQVADRAIRQLGEFDLIIDDGSHTGWTIHAFLTGRSSAATSGARLVRKSSLRPPLISGHLSTGTRSKVRVRNSGNSIQDRKLPQKSCLARLERGYDMHPVECREKHHRVTAKDMHIKRVR